MVLRILVSSVLGIMATLAFGFSEHTLATGAALFTASVAPVSVIIMVELRAIRKLLEKK